MLAHDDATQFATAVLAYVAAAEGDRIRVRLSLAGHPPALILRSDGRIDSSGAFGTMLALRADPTFHDTHLILDPGDVLLLYTDGVTEAGRRGAAFGGGGLAELLGTLAGHDPQRIVDAVEQAVIDVQEGRPRDDIALLALAPWPDSVATPRGAAVGA